MKLLRRWVWLTHAVQSIFLARKNLDRGPEYTLCGGTFIQAVTCASWGFPQVLTSPRLVIPPWTFLLLLITGRFISDLHIYTSFRKYPEFLWAREQMLSTKLLVMICATLFFIEYLGLPVVSYFKLLVVPMWYSLSVFGVTAPASFRLAFKAKAHGQP